MNIHLDQLMPIPLKSRDLSHSKIWQQQIEFRKGVQYQIQAPSGTGKSTFIQILYGNRTDYEGAFYWDDQLAADLGINDWASLRKNKLSIVFQDLRLFLDLTAEENLKLKFHLDSALSWKEVEEMISALGVDHLIHQKAQFLSFGERQRFAIIRALIQPYDWLLLDEPFSHLDKDNAHKAAQLIQQQNEKRSAGMLVAGLNEDDYFPYHETVNL